MNFVASVKTCYKKYFVLAGRASRREYWFFRLYVILCSSLISIISGLFPQFVAEFPPVAFPIASIFMFALPDTAVQVRRFHDRGLSGYWLLPSYVVIPVIAIVGVYFMSHDQNAYAYSQPDAFIALGALWLCASIAVLVVSALPSVEGENRYGAPPIETVISNSAATKKTDALLTGRQHQTTKQTDPGHLFDTEGKDIPSHNPNGKITSVDDPTKTRELTDAAKILLKYRDDIKHLHDELCSYPLALNVTFANKMAVDPTKNPEEIFRFVILQHLGCPDMQWTDDIWLTLKKVASHSEKACKEVAEVFPLLSATMSPTAVMMKVVETMRGKITRSYAFPGKNGQKHKLNRHADSSFSIDDTLDTFHNTVDVYDLLQTPHEKRVSYYLLEAWQEND